MGSYYGPDDSKLKENIFGWYRICMMSSTIKYFQRMKTRIRRYMGATDNRILVMFAVEGLLITLVNNLVGNYNNLFATRLGANDFELSLVITLPQLVGMLVLIPGGILTDRMPNKRNMIIMALALISGAYFLMGFTPMLGSIRLAAFLLLLSVSSAPMTVYNVAWQAYFSDVVVRDEARNNILTVRNGINFLIGVVIPLSCGAILAAADTTKDKLLRHQIFVWLAGMLLILQIFVLKRINGGQNNSVGKIKPKEIKAALTDLAKNKRFLGFAFVTLFFYMSWQIDWTLYFLGEVNYLGMNEAWLSYASIGGAVVQFITIRFWSRLNLKKGVRFSIIFGGLGLTFFPLVMIFTLGLPGSVARPVFVGLNALANFAFATVYLNIPLMLLQVLPEKNKTLNISLYTMLTMLSNAFMPMVGVAIYRFLGADLKAYKTVYLIVYIMRLVSTALWFTRWWLLRREEEV